VLATFGAINWSGNRFEGDNVTTTDILGPFYRPGSLVRSNLIPAGSNGEVINLTGTVFQKDGKTPLANTLFEAWHCDDQEKYDNASDDYLFQGAVKTSKDGKYAFKTMVPVPCNDGGMWRPAYVHLRVSSGDHQDLITQIYFKSDKHIEKDAIAASPQAINRILQIRKNASQENEVKFDIKMG